MTVRRVVGGIGRTLITIGVLILLFVAYQLWGTGISEARDQSRLRHQFEAKLRTPPPTPGTRVNPADIPPPTPEGDALAIIKIPRINLEKTVVQGVGTVRRATPPSPATAPLTATPSTTSTA
jgi:sortase A